VAFISASSNLVPGDANNLCDTDYDIVYSDNCPDAFIRSRLDGSLKLISLSDLGVQANAEIQDLALSGDGLVFGYETYASSLVEGDTNTAYDVFANEEPAAFSPSFFAHLPVLSTTLIRCGNILENSSFETREGWNIVDTDYDARLTHTIARTGRASMQAGIINKNDNVYAYSDFYQTVALPPDAVSIRLYTWLYPQSDRFLQPPFPETARFPDLHASAQRPDDLMYILVMDESNDWVDTLFWELRNDRTWILREFDLSRYKGQTITLQFGAYNNGGGAPTVMFVDDTELIVCKR
jgi:hypothetical protein